MCYLRFHGACILQGGLRLLEPCTLMLVPSGFMQCFPARPWPNDPAQAPEPGLTSARSVKKNSRNLQHRRRVGGWSGRSPPAIKTAGPKS